jgi:hypothetical protein
MNSKANANSRNFWHRFEDFWWYKNHHLFEEHASQKKALVSTPHRVVMIRVFCLCLMSFNMICGFSAHIIGWSDAKWLTRWGIALTDITLVLGLMHTPYKKVH